MRKYCVIFTIEVQVALYIADSDCHPYQIAQTKVKTNSPDQALTCTCVVAIKQLLCFMESGFYLEQFNRSCNNHVNFSYGSVNDNS